MNLYQKLVEVRKVVPYLKKDTKGDQYEYVSGSTVLGKLKEKMDDLGLLLVPAVKNSTMTTLEITENGQTKVKPTVHAEMEMIWINADNPEEQLKVPFACFGTQDDISKAFGSALTYSERYFLLKFFNIATDKDDPDSFQDKNGGGGAKPASENNITNISGQSDSLKCAECGCAVSERVADFSNSKFKKTLCMDCQNRWTVKTGRKKHHNHQL